MEIDRGMGRLSRRRHIVWYFIDEASILLVGVLAVVFAKAFRMFVKGRHPTWADVFTGSLEMVLALLATVVLYAGVHSFGPARAAGRSEEWSVRGKPAWGKRALVMVSYGLNWRDFLEG